MDKGIVDSVKDSDNTLTNNRCALSGRMRKPGTKLDNTLTNNRCALSLNGCRLDFL